LGYDAIDATITPHHLIYGSLNAVDDFNWTKKVEVAAKKSGFVFDAYPAAMMRFTMISEPVLPIPVGLPTRP
jgi:hypothetical protein